MSVRQEWRIRSHRVSLEEPDLVVVTFVGSANVDDIRDLLKVFREVSASQPFYVLVNISTSPDIEPAARSLLTRELRPEWFRGAVYVGARPLQKLIIKGLSVGFHLLGKWSFEFQMVETEEQGRTLLARMRDQPGALAS
jgi:hypothetical protein